MGCLVCRPRLWCLGVAPESLSRTVRPPEAVVEWGSPRPGHDRLTEASQVESATEPTELDAEQPERQQQKKQKQIASTPERHLEQHLRSNEREAEQNGELRHCSEHATNEHEDRLRRER